MNALDIFVKAYACLHNYPGVPVRVLSPFRVLVRWGAKRILPKYLAKPKTAKPKKRAGITVSFTSFPARINNVWQVVECMRRQTYLPEKIYLWLSKEQFPTPDSIPQSLRSREDEVFQIRMVDGDIRSYKKFYYIAKESPDSLVFLIDDDIYYDTRLIERVMKAHDKYPEAIICNYGYHIGRNNDGSLKPYKQWIHEWNNSIADDLFFGSGGGTLFRPSEMFSDLTDMNKAQSLCPIADDIWLNAMARMAGKKMIMLRNGGDVLPVYSDNNVELFRENQLQSKNDEQIEAINKYYQNTLF
ncbi:MAG: hypothetical protein J5671_06245 [Bacteroidaceae bacterium]|nr:hypothetical protein [Bacteroidaceae bacterium]